MIKNVLKIIFLLTLTVSLQAQKTLPESDYPYWPSYEYLESDFVVSIKAQEWISKNHVVSGWDWSLPKEIIPSPRSLVGLQRIMGLQKKFAPMKLSFPSNPVAILWMSWKDIEAEEGVYDFSKVEKRIDQANAVGNEVVLRILGHNVSRGVDVDSLKKGAAPLWLSKYEIPKLPKKTDKNNLNYDPAHPEFHKHYIKLINELANTDIPKKVKAAYVGYASPSFGDEGIGPHHNNADKNDREIHVIERLDAFAHAFKGMEYKVFMGGPSNYGFSKGFGVRRGFVEMYLYTIPDRYIGQYIDEEGYLEVDETAPVIANNAFNGEVNEEYEPAWATKSRGFRFGRTTNSFPYRYFISNLRALQMRCSYIHTTGHLIPKMLPFMAQELGRTVDDAPDVWSFLYTARIKQEQYNKYDTKGRKKSAQEAKEGISLKNMERWLYQRDSKNFTTTPAIKINHAIKMWMVQRDHYYDYIARQGSQIGFDVDDRWLEKNKGKDLAIKISYFDTSKGVMQISHMSMGKNRIEEQELLGDGSLKTVSVFLKDMDANSMPNNYDFVLKSANSSEKITISMVRLININSKI